MKKKDYPTIRECLAFELCRGQRVGCEACLELSVEAWREHVASIKRLPPAPPLP